MPGPEKLRTTLREERGGPTSVSVDVVIDADGTLRVEGQDLGEGPKQFFGSSDYEYHTIVSSEQKDRLLLALLVERFGSSGTPTSDLETWLREHQIPFQVFRWP